MAARDVLIGTVIIFVIAITFFTIKFTADTVISRIVAIPQINSSAATVEAFQGTTTNVNNRLDSLFFGLFIGLFIGIIITGWFVAAIPIFIFIYFIIALIGVIFSTIFSNVWQQVTPASVFSTTVSTMPVTNHILTYLPIYISVMAFVGIVVIYAKPYIIGER